MMRAVGFCLVVLLLLPSVAHAQRRVTIRTEDGVTLTGTILTETREGYLFKPDGAATRVVPFASIVDLKEDGAAPGAPAASKQGPVQTEPTEAETRAGEPGEWAAPPTSTEARQPSPAPAPAPANAAVRSRTDDPVKPAQPAEPPPRSRLVAFAAGAANVALTLDPFGLFPFISLEGALGGRFPSSTYGLIGLTSLHVGLSGVSPLLGAGISRDMEDEGTIYGGIVHPLGSSEFCSQISGHARPGSGWAARVGVCVDTSGNSDAHMFVGVGWGFGT